MIHVSTGWLKNQPAWKSSKFLLEEGIDNIELSGGSYDEDQLKKLKELKKYQSFKVHNYFPPPKEPFVFNLASFSEEIISKTLNQIEIAMQYAIELDSPQYSFHGGFLMEPKVSELGKIIINRKLYERKEALKVFLDRLNIISQRAEELGVSLLIENNPLTKKNLTQFGSSPFLMVDNEECSFIMEETPSNVNLLIDFGHLKVSSKSLNFDYKLFLEKCDRWIQGYHLSDNNGLEDSNQKVEKKSWFWEYVKPNLDYYSLEVYDIPFPEINSQVELSKYLIKNK